MSSENVQAMVEVKSFFSFFYPSIEDDTQKRERAKEAELRAKEAENFAQTVKDPEKETKLRAIAVWYRARANNLHQDAIILLLQKERRRITAWSRVQHKKKDGQYRTKEGKYLDVGSRLICSSESFTILQWVLRFLEAEVRTTPSQEAMAYVTNQCSHIVSVIATDSVGIYPCGVAITPDNKKVYVVEGYSHRVSVIDTDNYHVVAVIEMGRKPDGIKITSDGKQGYVTHLGSNEVTVIDTSIYPMMATIFVEQQPNGVAITPDGNQVYVKHLGSNDNTLWFSVMREGGLPYRVAMIKD
jgi:YVTN family beta-propeller protein